MKVGVKLIQIQYCNIVLAFEDLVFFKLGQKIKHLNRYFLNTFSLVPIQKY